MAESGLLESARGREDETLRLLEHIVRFESPTGEKPAIDTLVDFLQRELEERDGHVERLAQVDYGDVLVARWPGSIDAAPLFVMTHVDTVWPLGSIRQMPWERRGNELHGPGVYDMKASVAMMLSALDIRRAYARAHRPIVWMINTEEEVGSPVSRPILETLARDAACVLCLEPPVPPRGALKTQRKGVGMFTLEVRGRASHAGADYTAGVSAIEELARQVQWLHGLSDPAAGTTVNVGIVNGGTKRNVVAAFARAEVDLRVTTVAEAERVVPQILGAQPSLVGAQITVTGGLNRPPMERSPSIISAFDRARVIAAEIGQDLEEGSTGGGSDGNFTAALGVPTLDGLGCPGDGAHADHEHIAVDQLAPRTALLAALLTQW